MKIILFLLLLLPLYSYSQNEKVVDSEEINFLYFIDSVKINMKKTFLPSHLKNVNFIEKDGIVKVFISSKGNYLSLESLDKLDENIKGIKNKVFIVDDNLIKSPSEIKIDKGVIRNIEIIRSAEFEDQSSVFTIIKITTNNKQKGFDLNKNKKIMIRGTDLVLNK